MPPRTVPPALLAALAVLVLALLFTSKVSRKMPDLEVYWTAAVRARAAAPLYRAEDQHYQFKYLPAFAVLAIPGGILPLPAAKAAWFVISVLLVISLVALSLRILPERRKPAWVIVVLTTVAMLKFFGHEIVLGQMNALFAVIVAGAVVALQRKREATAGWLVGLAILVKPYAVIFLPWLAARRRVPSMAAAGASLLAILTLPALVYGFAGDIALHRAWWKTVTDSTAPNLTNADNVSVAAMYAKWLGAGHTASALASGTGILILALAAFVFSRRARVRSPEALEAALLLTAIPLLSPQGWDYVFLISTPAIACLVNFEDRLAPPVRPADARRGRHDRPEPL